MMGLIGRIFFVLVFGFVLMAEAVEHSKPFGENVILRGNLDNARTVFEKTGRGTVAFMGGSITEMEGYRPMVCEILKRRFPSTKFTFIAAGISSTCSTTGAFRWDSDVGAKGPIDLFLVEFAVNDEVDGHFTKQVSLRGFEGIIRKARMANPKMDIVTTFFATEGTNDSYKKGETPIPVQAHGAVAAYYGVSALLLSREVQQEIAAGTLTWKDYGGIHPAPRGNAICARMFDELFRRAGWDQPLRRVAKPHSLPEKPMDRFSYFYGGMISPAKAKIVKDWIWSEPAWDRIPGYKRGRFLGFPHFWTEKPGAVAEFSFSGTCIGAYLTAGADAGWIEVQIDGGAPKRLNLMQGYSKQLHYPYTLVFADELADGPHQMRLVFPEIPENKGRAARLMQFVVNGRK